MNSTNFAFTNSGLQITLPVVALGIIRHGRQQIKTLAAILNCRIDGGWIALRLKEVDGPRNLYSVFCKGQLRRILYIDAFAARSATVVPLTILESEPPRGMGLRSALGRSREPLQLVFRIDQAALANFGLSIDGLFPSKSWRTFKDSPATSGLGLRSAQFYGQDGTARELTYGTVLLARNAQQADFKVLVSYCYGEEPTTKSVVRLQYWSNNEYPEQECRCSQSPCIHRLDLAPNEETLAQNSSFSIEEIPRATELFDIKSSQDMMVLRPSNLAIVASLWEELILGMKHVALELELSSSILAENRQQGVERILPLDRTDAIAENHSKSFQHTSQHPGTPSSLPGSVSGMRDPDPAASIREYPYGSSSDDWYAAKPVNITEARSDS